MKLSSVINLEQVNNTSITGHNNLTVLCVNGGRLFINCFSCHYIIEGITWIGCGGYSNIQTPVILLNGKYVKVSVQKCSFQHSLAPAIGNLVQTLTKRVYYPLNLSITIIQCSFINNHYYKDHGAAVYYSLDIIHNITYINFTIKNSSFSNNGPAKSIIYIKGRAQSTNYQLSINDNSYFLNNQAVPVYLSAHAKLNIKGEVAFDNNIAEYGAGIFIGDYSTVTFDQNSYVKFTNNSADHNGAAIFLNSHSNIIFEQDSIVKFHSNKAINGTIYSKVNSNVTFSGNCEVTFNSNSATQYGAAVYSLDNSHVIFDQYSNVKFINNSVDHNGAAIFLNSHSNIIFEQRSSVIFHSNKAINGTIYSKVNSNVTFSGNCEVTFNSNSATQYGAAVYSLDNSHVIFDQYSNVKFINNSVDHDGAAIFLNSHSNIIFEQDSIEKFHYNKATSGTIYSKVNSNVTFAGNCEVTFNSNSATQYGAAVYSLDNSHVIFDQYSNVKFINNSVDHNGAAIFLNSYSNIIFEQHSSVIFHSNKAINGTIYSKVNSNVKFAGYCNVTFNSNSAAQYGAAIYSLDNSHVTFTENSKVTFTNNIIPFGDHDIHQQLGGIIFSASHSYVSFENNSTIEFNNNIANFGAAIFSSYYSNITFKDRSRVLFNNNIGRTCGILTSALFSTITFNDNTNVTYCENTVSCRSSRYDESFAGAICTFKSVNVTFLGHSFITFTNNRADKGGAVAFSESNVIIKEYSTVNFNNNVALYSSGGAFVCSNNSNVTIKGNSKVIFNSNNAIQNGGAMLSYNICQIIFEDNSTSQFINNNAGKNGGAIFNTKHSYITFKGNSRNIFGNNMADKGGTFYYSNSAITFEQSSLISCYNNEAIRSGGVGYFSLNSEVIFEGNTTVRFDTNTALNGGSILADDLSKFTFKDNSIAHFHNNLATVGGGAIKVIKGSSITVMNYTTINFTYNGAQYGAAVFMDTTAVIINNCDIECINFTNNIAKILGAFVYQDVTETCNSSCLNNSLVNISDELIATPPNELKFYDLAICIDDDNDTQCKSYFVQNVMLGTELVVPMCVYNYYNHTVNSTQFLVQPEIYLNYHFNGPNEVLLSCNELKGISITGNQIFSKPTHFSINITLNTALNPDWKRLLVKLTIELSPCHPGFWQYPTSKKCECYNANDIVFCSGSSSTIKRGYWFGNVSGKPTITFCPINYCNFTCCETTNGYYHLSPVRDDQCKSHRSGTACGSCNENYTLSFDSVECVHVKECGIGWTIIIIILIVLYWIIIIVAVFTVMHFKVEIGYLYAITFYYSVVDILLNHNWYLSSALYTIINVVSSIAKITPQFLGQFCVIINMSGIDQQFIHYIHPVAISLFLVLITVLARRSRRLSSFISKGIIHVICCLLLLSYTSLATTSLLLMRPLIFQDVDKIYTYLSPNVEYFHGRHLAYAIVAIICTLIIVIGLPLLLALEPFLNSKINFVKVKPLLDQFQGCYKDQYRYFAAYYMICRLVIIIIVTGFGKTDHIVTIDISRNTDLKHRSHHGSLVLGCSHARFAV